MIKKKTEASFLIVYVIYGSLVYTDSKETVSCLLPHLPSMQLLKGIKTWRSGYCYLNKGECDLNQSKYDSFVKRMAKNNN